MEGDLVFLSLFRSYTMVTPNTETSPIISLAILFQSLCTVVMRNHYLAPPTCNVCAKNKSVHSRCCISIPRIFVIDLDSLRYAKIGFTPDDALQIGLYTEPYHFNSTSFFEFLYGYLGESCGEKGYCVRYISEKWAWSTLTPNVDGSRYVQMLWNEFLY